MLVVDGEEKYGFPKSDGRKHQILKNKKYIIRRIFGTMVEKCKKSYESVELSVAFFMEDVIRTSGGTNATFYEGNDFGVNDIY